MTRTPSTRVRQACSTDSCVLQGPGPILNKSRGPLRVHPVRPAVLPLSLRVDLLTRFEALHPVVLGCGCVEEAMNPNPKRHLQVEAASLCQRLQLATSSGAELKGVTEDVGRIGTSTSGSSQSGESLSVLMMCVKQQCQLHIPQ